MAQPVTVTEFYTPATDQWTIVKPLVNLHKEASLFCMGQFVYIFGGYNIATKTGQKLMSRYDTVNDVWQTIGQVSSGMTGVGCCLLDLPWFLIDSIVATSQKSDEQPTMMESSAGATTSRAKLDDLFGNRTIRR